jgi:hypothetical protein
MKPSYYLPILLILSILFLPLTACTGASGTTTQSGGATIDMTLASQLALGTLKLDETSYPIDKAQAAELLPLWKALRALSSSDTTAPQEIEALVKQIQNTLTADQVNAITAMQLTNQELTTFMQENVMAQGAANPEVQATRQARRQNFSGGNDGPGGFPGGGPPDGGFPGGDGGGDPPQGTGTPGAGRQVSQNASGINPMLINLVIQFLEAK